jgi:hypothetical protein
MVKRFVVCGGLILVLVGIYLFSWYVALSLLPVFRGVRMFSGHEVALPFVSLTMLWIWAEYFEIATGWRIPTPFGFACVGFAGVVTLATLLA